MAKAQLPYRRELVLGSAEHLGYRYIVAYQADSGLTRESIAASCAEAADEGAPKDAICKRAGRWYTRGEITEIRIRSRLDSYTAALIKYEDELARERKTQR